MKLKKLLAVFLVMLSLGCAAINPNPNVGLRSVDMMVRGGNCSGAIEILNSAAERNEPWAQLRLGYFSLTKQCPGISTEDGIKWLTKAACYEAKTDWEKGSELSMGPSGFFNTREDSLQALDVLQMTAEATSPSVESMLVKKWFWVNRAAHLFESDNPKQKPLVERLKAIESHMSSDSLKQARTTNLCEQNQVVGK